MIALKWLVDECLSPDYVGRLAIRGYPDAIHPIHVGLLGARDDQIVARALADDRSVITANRVDYERLLGREVLHPGAIIVDALEKEPTWQLILVALSFIGLQPRPVDYMVNRVVEVSAARGILPFELSSGAV